MRKCAASVCAILCVTCGCTVVNANRFRLVDASDGHPIAGVDATGSFDMWQPSTFLGWPVFCRFGRSYATSDADGLVQFDRSENDVTFAKVGYESVAAFADWPGYRQRSRLISLRTFPWEDERTALILLQPKNRE